LGWWQSTDGVTRDNVLAMTGETDDIVGSMIDLAKNCESPLCIIPVQDLLRLDSSGRMNVPGVEQGNWQWQFQWDDLKL